MAFLLLPFSLTLCLLNFVRANLLICHYIHPCLFTVYLLGQHTCNLVSTFYCPTENFLHQLFLDPFAYNICFVFDTLVCYQNELDLYGDTMLFGGQLTKRIALYYYLHC